MIINNDDDNNKKIILVIILQYAIVSMQFTNTLILVKIYNRNQCCMKVTDRTALKREQQAHLLPSTVTPTVLRAVDIGAT